MTTWVPRNQIPLDPPALDRLSLRQDQIDGVAVHWNGGPVPYNALYPTWHGLQTMAMSGQNVNHTAYGDIEYNAGITYDGRILAGRDNKFVGAHATSFNNVANRTLLGVCMLGNEPPTEAATQALGAYLFVVIAMLHRPDPIVLCSHREIVTHGGISTQCPGDAYENVVRYIRAAHNLRAW